MATSSPPLLTTATTIYNNNAATATATSSPNNNIIPPQTQQQTLHSSSTSTLSSIIIVIIVIASAIIISAFIYLLLRFISRRCSRVQSVHSFSSSTNDVVSEFPNDNRTREHHVIYLDNNNDNSSNLNKLSSLPLFTFSSLTGNIPGGDCAVCLSKFNGVDQLRLLPLCCHAFHVECIDAWLKTNQTCPLCRSTVNPSEDDVLNKILSISDRNNSFRIEIGSVSRRRTPDDSGHRRSYSVGGSFEYVLDDGYEVPVESISRRERESYDRSSGDKDLITPEPPGENIAAEIGGGSGRRNWLRDYVDRVSVSISSRSHSFRGSGRFYTGSSRRSEAVDDYEGGRVGEEISELFRWLSGV